MDLGPLRALALECNLAAHGVDITVTPPDGPTIATRGIWLTPVTEDMPPSLDFQRKEPRRVLALSRAEVASVPRGTIVIGPEKAGDAVQPWKVDGAERQEADHIRVFVVSAPEYVI